MAGPGSILKTKTAKTKIRKPFSLQTVRHRKSFDRYHSSPEKFSTASLVSGERSVPFTLTHQDSLAHWLNQSPTFSSIAVEGECPSRELKYMDKGKEPANEEERPLGLDEEDLTAIGLNPSTVSRGNDEALSDNLLGRVVKSEDEAYRLYNEYAFEKGFSIRKAKTRYYEGTRSIRQKEFVCSKEGFKEDPSTCETPSYNRLDVRTGCKAMIRFTVKDDEWKVTHFVAEHNHELASVEERHLLRSARNVYRPRPKGLAVVPAETSPTENTGFVLRDLCDIEGQQKLVFIEGGDAQSLFQWFKKKKNNDIMFFHDVQLDQEGRATNFFWSDGKSRIDYGYFGDVIVLDTTYRINKYNLICAPLFGINHHRGKVMFGCAFLLDESSTSFIWLFKSFLECMGNKAPKTIITYQDDQALIRAVEQVFPDTRHLLCPWHIAKRASSHLVGLYSNTGFCQLFRKCTHHCDNELEFEQVWQRMVEEYDCRNNSWLKTIYRTRQQWSTAFSNNTFSCGLISSQKSEVGDVFNGLSGSQVTSLTKFALEVDNLVARWRDLEVKSNFRCKHGQPTLIIKKSSICHQAAQIYTHKIFELFQEEYVEGVGALRSTEVSSNGTLSTFQMGGEMDNEKVYIVHFDSSTLTVSCSCKKFESMGFLCSHCLSVLHMKNVNSIPQQYIVKRWTKNARERVHTHDPSDLSRETEVEYHTEMMRWVYDMITRSQKSSVTRTLLRNGFQHIDQEVKRLEAELDLTVEGTSSADGQKRKRNAESSKPRKRNERTIASPPTQAETHSNVPFDSVPPSIQGSIDLSMAPYCVFSPQYIQHAHFAPQEPSEQFQRQ